MHFIKKHVFSLLPACALLFAGLFCHTAALAADSMKIGTLPAADSLILHAAVKDGVFAAHGLDVETVPFQSALELGAAMRAGSLDGHFGDIINVLMQNENGAPQIIVATTSHSTPKARFFGLAVSPKSAVQSPAELKDKACAIGRATIVEFVLDALLENEDTADMPEKRDIRQIPVRLQKGVNYALLPYRPAALHRPEFQRRITSVFAEAPPTFVLSERAETRAPLPFLSLSGRI